MKPIFYFGNLFPAYNRVDVSHNVFNVPHYIPRHHEAEMVVGITDCASAIMELQEFANEEHIPLNFITEVSWIYCIFIVVMLNRGQETTLLAL